MIIPMPELTVRGKLGFREIEGIEPFYEFESVSPNDTLKPVQIQTFTPKGFTGKTGGRGDGGGNRERDTNNGNGTSDYISEYPYETTHIVQEGEDVYLVAAKMGYISPSALRKLNGLTNATLQVGQVLRIPLREPPPNAEED